MTLLLIFAATLFVAALLSGLARRTVLSTAVLFLVVGFVLGSPALGVLDVRPDDRLVEVLAELALFSVLFTDGMRAGIHDLRDVWRLPGRALLLGMPLTLGLIALLGHFLLGLGWIEAALLGAALSPTDPVFAHAIIGRDNVPFRLRQLLNVESGLNDGLALPVVLIGIQLLQPGGQTITRTLTDLVLGVVVGVGVPAAMLLTERYLLPVSKTERYKPLSTVALGLLVLAIAYPTRVNLFLAAFTAGVTTVSLNRQASTAFRPFGEITTELLKLLALLMFGALISLELLTGSFAAAEYLFIVLVVVAARPLALLVALYRAGLSRHEWLAAAWFGPKGFASMVYGLIIVNSGIDQGSYLFHLIALTVGLSIVAHSSTDVPVARWFRAEEEKAEPQPRA